MGDAVDDAVNLIVGDAMIPPKTQRERYIASYAEKTDRARQQVLRSHIHQHML